MGSMKSQSPPPKPSGAHASDLTTDELTISTTSPTIPTVNSQITSNQPHLFQEPGMASAPYRYASSDHQRPNSFDQTFSLATDSELIRFGLTGWLLDLSGISPPLLDSTYQVKANRHQRSQYRNIEPHR